MRLISTLWITGKSEFLWKDLVKTATASYKHYTALLLGQGDLDVPFSVGHLGRS